MTDPTDGSTPRSTLARLRFLVTPRWIALIIAAISFTLACYFFLAPWQFDRNAEQSAQNKAISAALAADPVAIDRLMSTEAQPPDDAIWHTVTATGSFDPDGQAYIRLRHDNDGGPAFEVVVPFVTAAGPTVLVDRGYVPFQSVQAGAALPALPEGTVTVHGRIKADQIDPKHRPAVSAPDGRNEYTAAASTIIDTDTPVYRGYLQLEPHSPGVIEAIALPEQDSGPFFSYAIQWLSFGAIAVIGLGYFIYREFTDPVSGDIYLPDEDGDDGASGHDEANGYDEAAGPDAARNGARVPVPGSTPAPVAGEARDPAARPARRRRKFDKTQLYDAE